MQQPAPALQYFVLGDDALARTYGESSGVRGGGWELPDASYGAWGHGATMMHQWTRTRGLIRNWVFEQRNVKTDDLPSLILIT